MTEISWWRSTESCGSWKTRTEPTGHPLPSEQIDHHVYPDENGTLPDGWAEDVLARTARGQFVAIHDHSIQLSESDMVQLCSEDCLVYAPPDVMAPDNEEGA